MKARFRIVIVDDHKLVAESLAQALRPHHDVVAVVYSSDAALRSIALEHPDVVLLDIALGGENGFDLVPLLAELAPYALVALLTNYNDCDFQTRGRELGVKGFIAKTETMTRLLEALHSVANGEEWYSEPDDDVGYLPSNTSATVHLNARQIEILRGLDRGLTYKQLGHELGLSENTIDVYLRRIRHVLGGHKPIELVRLAREQGVLNTRQSLSPSTKAPRR